jgi:uncharacterized MAPEG superfamily protein
MESHNLVAIVTVLALLVFFATALRVGAARSRFSVEAPATTGHPEFERHFRVQMNTLEGLVIFLPSLWMFAVYWNDLVAAGLGLVWIIGRVIYMTAYVKEPRSRSLGFGIQSLGMIVLLLGSLAGAVWSIIHAHAL